uniref:Uncharacterized protein n=1 Tax=Spongospora subterranea TaxID=70186 RepID=A0A0H5QHA4_9EUKA|eukprot:CRZ00721.1 hypothetical protein [Spongospora subterranea]
MSSANVDRQIRRLRNRFCSDQAEIVKAIRKSSQGVNQNAKKMNGGLGYRLVKQKAMEAAMDRYNDNVRYIEAQHQVVQQSIADDALLQKITNSIIKSSRW